MGNTAHSTPRHSFFDRILGPPLETAAAAHQEIGKRLGLAVFASDALSSVAYATEEILIILALAGSVYFGLSIPLAIVIGGLLVILTVSYRQTIFNYPNGGGAYIVGRDNLGEVAALVAGAALMTDYILTVAVSISAGVAQIISAFPALEPLRVEIALAAILIMAVINLRGIKEASTIFAIPTYFFVFSAFLMLAAGFWKYFNGSLSTVTGVESTPVFIQSLTLFLLLRAFSSGCTALTGVEAISNGISAFKEPKSANAAKTMAAMSGILLVLFVGITILAHQVQAVPSETETVISQVARTVFGPGPIYLITLAATTVILIMAANTSFAGFPRLAALQAADGYLPRQLTVRGSRLVFSWGILALASFASLLVVIFQASVTALIPLYAIGVFLSFTISQSGMVRRWQKVGQLNPDEEIPSMGLPLQFDPQWRWRQVINIIGAAATAVVTVVFTVTKFMQGAWLTILLIPILVWIFSRIHRHYNRVADQLGLGGLQVIPHDSPVRTILLVDSVHAGTLRLVNFAISLGNPWEAVHIAIDPERIDDLKQKWVQRIGIGELKILPSPYRSITGPLREYIAQIQEQDPKAFIHILLGQLAMPNYWEQALHRNTDLIVDLVLRDMDRVVVTSVPYQIDLSQRYAARLMKETSEEYPFPEEESLQAGITEEEKNFPNVEPEQAPGRLED